MKIALLTDGIQPYVLGGMQKHSFYIAKYLAKNKMFVDLYHTQENFDYDISELEVFTDEEKKYIKSFVVPFPMKGALPGHYLRRSFQYAERVYEVFKQQEQVDFIYAKGFAGWKLIDEKRKGKNFPPIGVKFHGLNMFQKPPSFKGKLEQYLFKGPVKFNMLNADYVFSYGGKITDITKKVGVEEKHIIEIPTGIENESITNEPSSNNSPIRFLYIGRYERLKGVEELSKAIKELQNVNFEFHFIGPIPEKLQINSKKVIYHGLISDSNKVQEVIDSCDVLCCPSYSEGMPNVIIESMARGLAILATDVGAINILVSEKNGWLIKEPSVNDIKKAIQNAIDLSKEELTEKKKYSLEITKTQLSWEVVAENLLKKLKSII